MSHFGNLPDDHIHHHYGNLFWGINLPPRGRCERSPSSEATTTMYSILSLQVHRNPTCTGTELVAVLEQAYRCGDVTTCRGDAMTKLVGFDDGVPKLPFSDLVEKFSRIALAYAMDGLWSGPRELNLAWTYIKDAASAEASAFAAWEQEKQTTAKKARLSDARHAESRQMRQFAIDWYRTNCPPGISKDAAAELIAGKVVNAKFRTVRDWLSRIKQ